MNKEEYIKIIEESDYITPQPLNENFAILELAHDNTTSYINLLVAETNQRIDEEVGNISLALDEIIALQNSLIGGEA